MSGAGTIAGLLPHRYPMLLVDAVRAVEPGVSLEAIKAVTVNEPWYAGVAGQAGADLAYPAVLVLESWCQAAGVLAAWERPNPDVLEGAVMLFGSLSEVTFGRPVVPGDVLEHRVRVVRSLSDTLVCEGESTAGEDTVLTVGRVVMALRSASVLAEAVGVAP